LTVDEAIESLTGDGITQPMLFEVQQRIWIKTDATAVCVNQSCFDDCIEQLMYCFFVFNVSYPPELKIVYGLLERVLKMKPTMAKSTILDDFLSGMTRQSLIV
jgi:hypothetical protein